jgi:hypothetical protein
LAKAVVGDAVCPDLSKSLKIGSGGTNQGVILGTAAYMSPEQARGQQVDKRTDIWAFGCVLYEMLTGNQAFGGETMTDTLAAVVEREPDWSALPATTPTAVQRLLVRCLDKDARHRLHDIADARIEIEDALSGASRTPPETAVVDPRQWPVRLPWSLAAIASFVAFVAVGALTWNVRAMRQARTAPPRISRTTIASSGTAAVALNAARSLAITPDGTRVVYVGNNGRQLYVRPLDQLDPTAIARGVAPLNWVCVSPDGQWVGFVDGDTLKKVAITGGPAVTIAQPVGAATWAPDDTIIVAWPRPVPVVGQALLARRFLITRLTGPRYGLSRRHRYTRAPSAALVVEHAHCVKAIIDAHAGHVTDGLVVALILIAIVLHRNNLPAGASAVPVADAVRWSCLLIAVVLLIISGASHQ